MSREADIDLKSLQVLTVREQQRHRDKSLAQGPQRVLGMFHQSLVMSAGPTVRFLRACAGLVHPGNKVLLAGLHWLRNSSSSSLLHCIFLLIASTTPPQMANKPPSAGQPITWTLQ